MLRFTIFGKPKPLIRHFQRKDGRTFDPSYNDKKAIKLKTNKFAPKTPIEGSIRIYLQFYMPRPKSHFRTGKFKNEYKPNVPIFHTNTPDIDNLIKMILDSLNKKFFIDDKQICQLQAEKLYCDKGEQPRTEIIIEGAD